MYSGKEPELIEGDMFQAIIPLNRTSDVPNDVPVSVSVNVSVNVPLNVTAEKILTYIADKPGSTYEELAEALSVSRRTIQRNIVKLQEIGRLQRVGSDKSGYWEIISDESADKPR
jgi:predicted HTH transcriptional regulator